ncbi:hypothetical protein NMG60_11030576 [Bertholletia excelsa]
MESAKSSHLVVNTTQKASTYDELLMQHSLHFADNLKDMKILKNQLYSAAQYFEASYSKDNQQQLVVETLKDYINQAIVNTVDHLGSVAYKLSNFLDQKVDEFCGVDLQFSCIEQKLRTYQEFAGSVGLSHGSMLVRTPKHHKLYSLPDSKTVHGVSKNELTYSKCSPCAEYDFHQPKNAIQARVLEPLSSSRRTLSKKGHSRHLSMEAPPAPGTFSFARTVSKKALESRSVSPHRFTLKRSGSTSDPNRLIAPSFPTSKQQYWQYPLEPQRPLSVSKSAGKDMTKEIQLYSKRSKPLFKALLSMGKQTTDWKL